MPTAKKAGPRLRNTNSALSPGPGTEAVEGDLGTGYYYKLFKSFGVDADGRIAVSELAARLRESGISETDPRVTEVWAALRRGIDIEGHSRIDLDRFISLFQKGGGVVAKSIRGDFVIPDFAALQTER